mgnify:FL=1
MSDLLPHVRPVLDRHGKTRYRFRRAGFRSGYINADPGTPEHLRRYAELLEGRVDPGPIVSAAPVKPKSIDDLARRMKQSPSWMRQAETTRAAYGGIIDRFCNTIDNKGRRYGERPVEAVTVVWLEKILGGMSDRPQAANQLRKTLRRMLGYAIKLKWRKDNPADHTDSYPKGKGYHCWTEEEIAQYRAHHPNGSMARLVMELALNTAARKCNVARIERDHIRQGKIHVAHVKGGNETAVPLFAETQAAIDALPAAPIRHLVVTGAGKPYTVAGLGNAVRDWCNAAGLPHCSLHGLRKAQSRRLAEAFVTDAGGRAFTGQKKNETFAYYAAAANSAALAEKAVSNLQDRGFVQPQENDRISDA